MRIFTISFLLVLFLFPFAITQARIIHVPADSSTIQGGINGVVDGDTVLVAEGHYYERINFNGKRILVTGEFMNDHDPLHIQNTIIDGDTSGTVVSFSNGEDSTSIIQGFTLQNGMANRGGGIACSQSSPFIVDCIITHNTAKGGGGISCLQSSPTINSCTIADNKASFYPAGGNYTITDNKANSGPPGDGCGGGILCVISSSPTISNCTIAHNTAFVPLGAGAGGGIACMQSSPMIAYCAIYKNVAGFGWGGGIACASSFLTILNCTITQNGASNGGGIFCSDCDAYSPITNTILWNDSPDEIYTYSGLPPIWRVTYSDIKGGWYGTGNLNCCPMFCNPNTADYYLAANSCCVGAGQGGVNIGTFGVGCPGYICGDANGDGEINAVDVVYLINYLFIHGPSPDPLWAGDANCDATVNSSDVVYLINYLFIDGPSPC